MVEITTLSGFERIDAPSYICSQSEFTPTTDKSDGTTLIVIDESTHALAGTYIAFGGYWNTL